jgi:hypothetical protein
MNHRTIHPRALATGLLLALSGCGWVPVDFGPSDPETARVPASAGFHVVGDDVLAGVTVGDDVEAPGAAVGFAAFDLGEFAGGVIVNSATLVAEPVVTAGGPFAKLGTLRVDVLPGIAFDAFLAGTLTAEQLAETPAVLTGIGELSPGHGQIDLTALVGDPFTSGAISSGDQILLRFHFDVSDDADDETDAVALRAAPDGAPSLVVVFQIAGH